MRALVVDDSRATRAILRKLMADIGWDVVEARNGVEGAELIESQASFELALVDWNMPDLDGLGMIQRIRAQSAYDSLPLVMITTETDQERIAEALEAGANEYIMKPFDKNILLTKLQLLGLVPE